MKSSHHIGIQLDPKPVSPQIATYSDLFEKIASYCKEKGLNLSLDQLKDSLGFEKESTLYTIKGTKLLRNFGEIFLNWPQGLALVPPEIWSDVNKADQKDNFRFMIDKFGADAVYDMLKNVDKSFLNDEMYDCIGILNSKTLYNPNTLSLLFESEKWLGLFRRQPSLLSSVSENTLNAHVITNDNRLITPALQLIKSRKGRKILDENIVLIVKIIPAGLKLKASNIQTKPNKTSCVSLIGDESTRDFIRRHFEILRYKMSDKNHYIISKVFELREPINSKDLGNRIYEAAIDYAKEKAFKEMGRKSNQMLGNIMKGLLGDAASKIHAGTNVPSSVPRRIPQTMTVMPPAQNKPKTKKASPPAPSAQNKLKNYLEKLFANKISITLSGTDEVLDLTLTGDKALMVKIADLFSSKFQAIKFSSRKPWVKQENAVEFKMTASVARIDDMFDKCQEKIQEYINPVTTKLDELTSILDTSLKSRSISYSLTDTAARARLSNIQLKESSGDEKKTITLIGNNEKIVALSKFMKEFSTPKPQQCVGPHSINANEMKFEFSHTVNSLIHMFSNGKLFDYVDGTRMNSSTSSHLYLVTEFTPVLLASEEEKAAWVTALKPAFCYPVNDINHLFTFSVTKKKYTQITLTLPSIDFILEDIHGPEKNQKHLDCKLNAEGINEIAKRINGYFVTHKSEGKCEFNSKTMVLTITPANKKPDALVKVFEEVFKTLEKQSVARPVNNTLPAGNSPTGQIKKNDNNKANTINPPASPITPTDVRREMVSLLEFLVADFTSTNFGFFSAPEARNKAGLKWSIAYRQNAVQSLGAHKLSVLKILETVEFAITAHLDSLRKANLLKAPTAEDEKVFLRIPVKGDEVKFIINLNACSFERLHAEKEAIKEIFNIEIGKLISTEEPVLPSLEQSTLKLSKTPSPPQIVRAPSPEVLPSAAIVMEQYLRDVLFRAARNPKEFKNIIFYLNMLMEIPAPTSEVHPHDVVYSSAFKLYMFRLCETLAGSGGEDNVFRRLRNHIRHLSHLTWKEFHDNVFPLVSALSNFINVNRYKFAKNTLFSFLPEEVNPDAGALEKLSKALVQYDTKAVHQSKQPKSDENQQADYNHQLLQIDSITDVNVKFIKTAKMSINVNKGKLKCNKNKHEGELYRVMGHDCLDEDYLLLEERLMHQFAGLFQSSVPYRLG